MNKLLDWKQIVAGVIIGAILGIAGTMYLQGQQIASLQQQVVAMDKQIASSKTPGGGPEKSSVSPSYISITSPIEGDKIEVTKHPKGSVFFPIKGTLKSDQRLQIHVLIKSVNPPESQWSIQDEDPLADGEGAWSATGWYGGGSLRPAVGSSLQILALIAETRRRGKVGHPNELSPTKISKIVTVSINPMK